tara:strand:- start:325 stop:744 length:420 start_codon:yes stop_codon:yes gene_type:complete
MNYNNIPEDNISLSMKQIDTILDNERQNNYKSSWNKLDKSTKINKLRDFSNNYNCDNNEKEKLFNTLHKALEQNKLQKIKEVIYDVNKEMIVSIPTLTYIHNKFIIKNEKRISTSKSLPIKNKQHSTKKNKHKIDNKDK